MARHYPDTAGLMAAIQRELDRRQWTVTDMAQMVGDRFHIQPDSVGRIWRRAELSGRMSDWWADRLITALELWGHQIADEALRSGLDAWCPSCRGIEATCSDGLCVWCGSQTGGNTDCRPQGNRANAGIPYMADEATILEARRLYLTGLSLRAVADTLHERTAYRSASAFRDALQRCFVYRGWSRRDRIEIAIAGGRTDEQRKAARRAYARTWRKQSGNALHLRCAGVKANTGEPCSRWAQVGSAFCFVHDPACELERARQTAHARSHIGKGRDVA